ncbi:hypothetical protein FE784_23655 [Paenibacillus hemerocallicola]|uniref:Uncharacterized protein n=1 Tax=Paenibacillus hemerocallicola TaxID=1172614 RepID=A0A5C4T577_9BACL|nr:hypothetical protein [Paenibacillus hemerocallicola]TNJ63870.1 hypothetical protein FE784_23655 [Paenibacillus hemerocallicola]
MNKPIRKPAVKKTAVTQLLPRLTLWSDANFSGRRLSFRGNLGVRSLVDFNFNDVLSSFTIVGGANITLVLFSDINYQGNRRVFRGPTDVSFLNGFNDVTSSFVMSRRRLSNAEINRIQNRNSAPNNFAEVLRRRRK